MLKVGTTYTCKIVKVAQTFAIVEAEGVSGILHISEVSDYYVKNISDHLKAEKKYRMLLFKQENGKNYFSYKRINPKLLKIQSKINQTETGFANVLKRCLEELKK
jgi:predicted RNA-binding protein with RPS1 domain